MLPHRGEENNGGRHGRSKSPEPTKAPAQRERSPYRAGWLICRPARGQCSPPPRRTWKAWSAAQIPSTAAAPQNDRPAQTQQIIVASPCASGLVSRLKL